MAELRLRLAEGASGDHMTSHDTEDGVGMEERAARDARETIDRLRVCALLIAGVCSSSCKMYIHVCTSHISWLGTNAGYDTRVCRSVIVHVNF